MYQAVLIKAALLQLTVKPDKQDSNPDLCSTFLQVFNLGFPKL